MKRLVIALLVVLLLNIFLVSYVSAGKITVSIQGQTMSNQSKGLLMAMIIFLSLCKEKDKIICSPSYASDPTLGKIENLTESWRVMLLIGDWTLELDPGESVNVYLDFGKYVIVAEAYVETFFGERLAGTYRKNLRVDAKMLSGEDSNYGWKIILKEGNFR